MIDNAALHQALPSAAVFPGQGSQRPGMGRDFAQSFPAANAVFEEASDALGFDLKVLCFERDPRLNLTEFTQPAVLAVEIAMVRTLADISGFAPSLLAGHSLGEYTALVAAGVIPLAQAVRLVHRRGRLMQEAVPPGEGAMAAIMQRRVDRAALAACLDGLTVDIANDNAPGQVVISGLAADVAAALQRLHGTAAFTGAQTRLLNVSAPFHCRLMSAVEPPLRALLEEAAAHWNVAAAPRVWSNVTAAPHEPDRAAVVERLVGQVSRRVRWVEIMEQFGQAGIGPIIEIGPTATLRPFFQMAGLNAHVVADVATARRLFSGPRTNAVTNGCR